LGFSPPGIYGTLGVASEGNVPGGRVSAASWTDTSGNFWLFGGNGYDSADNYGVLNDLWKYDPATNEWTWVGGSSTVDQPGVYGTLGVASEGNAPGARSYATSWTDADGKLWLFGGNGFDSGNDLWKYDPATNEWTWVGGSGTNASQPGVYGTLGVASANNVPGSRNSASGWTDLSGNLWLFGGYGADSVGTVGLFNDLWKYDVATNEWTWVGGSSIAPSIGTGEPGVYGALGVASTGNVPGGRQLAAAWTDRDGNLWLFGGYGTDSADILGDLNDLWKYDPSANEWTWINGSSTVGPNGVQPGVYGTLGVVSAANVPRGRFNYGASWTDDNGNLWLFGGLTTGTPINPALTANTLLNDLWEFQLGAAAPVAVTPSVTVTPSASRITTAQPLKVKVTVCANGEGGQAPTGSVTLTGGGYTSKAKSLREGSATIHIPAGSLSTGVDTLTVTYTPDSSSSTTYNSATGTVSVKVTEVPKCHPRRWRRK
jgi:N-acetylneuraminic acid mutarotase